MNKAVFIDRDGVINPLVYYRDYQEWESPRTPEEFAIYPSVAEALQTLRQAGYMLFVVSNQPSYAKGKMTWDSVKAIEWKLESMSQSQGDLIEKCYYCYHHPQAVIPELAGECACRKPKTLFPETAVREYSLNPMSCFFIGDQDSDILCGQAMGFKTIKVHNERSAHKSGNEKPDRHAIDLSEAASIICKEWRTPHE